MLNLFYSSNNCAFGILTRRHFPKWLVRFGNTKRRLIRSSDTNMRQYTMPYCSVNGLSPVQRQTIIWTNKWLALVIWHWGTYCNDICIATYQFSYKKLVWNYRLQKADVVVSASVHRHCYWSGPSMLLVMGDRWLLVCLIIFMVKENKQPRFKSTPHVTQQHM